MFIIAILSTLLITGCTSLVGTWEHQDQLDRKRIAVFEPNGTGQLIAQQDSYPDIVYLFNYTELDDNRFLYVITNRVPPEVHYYKYRREGNILILEYDGPNENEELGKAFVYDRVLQNLSKKGHKPIAI